MAQFHELTIDSIDQITTQSVSISFKIPDSLLSNFEFEAGQYLTLKSDINGESVRRDYSICSSKNSGKLTVGIKEVEGGTFSVHANKAIVAGQTMEVAEPNGRFVFLPNLKKPEQSLLLPQAVALLQF